MKNVEERTRIYKIRKRYMQYLRNVEHSDKIFASI